MSGSALSMFKMAAAGAALFAVGLVGLACTDPDCIVACPSLVCVEGSHVITDHCGCATTCAPPPKPDSGTVKDAGNIDASPACPQINCPALRCSQYISTPEDLCSCPICLSTPDADGATDSGTPDSGPVCPPTICRDKVLCPGGYEPNPDPCGCPLCAHCGDGIVDTNLGEQCDLGKLNGVCFDAQGNRADAGQGNPEDAGCPLGAFDCFCPQSTFLLCTTMCQIPMISGM